MKQAFQKAITFKKPIFCNECQKEIKAVCQTLYLDVCFEWDETQKQYVRCDSYDQGEPVHGDGCAHADIGFYSEDAKALGLKKPKWPILL